MPSPDRLIAALQYQQNQNPDYGIVGNLIGSGLNYMQSPERTQQMQGVGNFLANTLRQSNEKAKAFNALSDIALKETKDTGKLNTPANMQMAESLSDAYNPAAIFIGASSPIFDKQMALKATQMAKKGVSPQEIWKTTGTVKGPDGQWRQEISDAKSVYDSESLNDLRALDNFNYLKDTQPLGGTLEHKELYKAYPEIGDMPVHFMPKENMKGAYAAYSPKKDAMTLSDQLTPEKARSSALHEIQHAIQEREGFAVGGNTRDFAKMRNDADAKITDLNSQMRDVVRQMDNPAIGKEDKNVLRNTYEDIMNQRDQLVPTAQIDPMQAYGHLMGEAEARLTQRRMDLTPAQRKQNYPFEYTGEVGYGLDVMPEKMINMTTEGNILERGLLPSNMTNNPNRLAAALQYQQQSKPN